MRQNSSFAIDKPKFCELISMKCLFAGKAVKSNNFHSFPFRWQTDSTTTVYLHTRATWKKYPIKIVDSIQLLDEHPDGEAESDRGNRTNAAQFKFVVSTYSAIAPILRHFPNDDAIMVISLHTESTISKTIHVYVEVFRWLIRFMV